MILWSNGNNSSERSSARRDRNKEVRPHHPSASSTPLASGTAANHLQVGDDVYKCLHGLAPSYLADVCIPVSSVVGRWQLRSADSGRGVNPLGTGGDMSPPKLVGHIHPIHNVRSTVNQICSTSVYQSTLQSPSVQEL